MSAEEWAAKGMDKYGLIVLTESGKGAQVEKVTHATAMELLSHLDEIKSLAPFMSTLNYGEIDPKVAGLCGPNPVKFHPGAVRAWEEAGYKIADCAKP